MKNSTKRAEKCKLFRYQWVVVFEQDSKTRETLDFLLSLDKAFIFIPPLLYFFTSRDSSINKCLKRHKRKSNVSRVLLSCCNFLRVRHQAAHFGGAI